MSAGAAKFRQPLTKFVSRRQKASPDNPHGRGDFVKKLADLHGELPGTTYASVFLPIGGSSRLRGPGQWLL
jgi:hypothetical protein